MYMFDRDLIHTLGQELHFVSIEFTGRSVCSQDLPLLLGWYRCLQNKRPLHKHTLRLSNPFPPKINVDEVTNGSGSACKLNTRFRKTISALCFQLWTLGARGRIERYDPTFLDGCLFCKHSYLKLITNTSTGWEVPVYGHTWPWLYTQASHARSEQPQ